MHLFITIVIAVKKITNREPYTSIKPTLTKVNIVISNKDCLIVLLELSLWELSRFQYYRIYKNMKLY